MMRDLRLCGTAGAAQIPWVSGVELGTGEGEGVSVGLGEGVGVRVMGLKGVRVGVTGLNPGKTGGVQPAHQKKRMSRQNPISVRR